MQTTNNVYPKKKRKITHIEEPEREVAEDSKFELSQNDLKSSSEDCQSVCEL